MSAQPYKNIPNLQVADYACRDDGRACALLVGNMLVFELDAGLVEGGTLSKLSTYLRVMGANSVFVIAWGYDSAGRYKPGYHSAVQLSWGVNAQVQTGSIDAPSGVSQGDTWYFAVYPGPFNKQLLKAVLEAL